MAENKTEEMKNQTMEAANKAEDNVKHGVDKLEHSKVGKLIPTRIDTINFKTIIYMAIIFDAIMTIPVCLMLGIGSAGTGFRAKLISFTKYIFFFFTLISPIVDFVTISMKLERIIKVLMLLKAIKVVFVIISFFLLNFGGGSVLLKLLLFVFLLGVTLIDFIVVYYTVIYFNRLKSDEYDENGNPISDKKENV